jgi:antitoxin HicB
VTCGNADSCDLRFCAVVRLYAARGCHLRLPVPNTCPSPRSLARDGPPCQFWRFADPALGDLSNYPRLAVTGSDKMNPMRTYTIVVEPEDGGYLVTVPALPGCFTRGNTINECRERAVGAIEVHIAGLRADDEPVPDEVGTPQLLAVTVAA